jgi:hypothetical protein
MGESSNNPVSVRPHRWCGVKKKELEQTAQSSHSAFVASHFVNSVYFRDSPKENDLSRQLSPTVPSLRVAGLLYHVIDMHPSAHIVFLRGEERALDPE